MIYIVTGHPRSGTSMMMAALQAGGMTLAYNPEREAGIEDHAMSQASGFNPSGVWELAPYQLKSDLFPIAYDGQVVKLVWDWLKWMKPYEGGYQVISMMRHPEEVHQSYEATVNPGRLQIRHNYMDRLNAVNELLMSREDVDELIAVNYEGVIENPNMTFQYLSDSGWPVNWEAAAEIPDKSLYRFRVGETITEGA